MAVFKSLGLVRYVSTSSNYLQQLKLVKNSKANCVQHVILNSTKTRNALSFEMLSELYSVFKEINADQETKCVLLSAEGKVFSAGHNLKELTKEKGEDHHKKVFAACTELMELIVNCPIPIVAKVDGVAAAAGCQLIAMCDIVLASQRSSFSTPGVSLGLFCSTPGVAVARAVPMKTASLMLYTGLPVTAEDAFTAGLISKVVPHEHLDSETETIIANICNKSLPVIRLGKKFLHQQVKLNILSAYNFGEQVMVENLKLADAQEGIKSFMEKRKPIFKNE